MPEPTPDIEITVEEQELASTNELDIYRARIIGDIGAIALRLHADVDAAARWTDYTRALTSDMSEKGLRQMARAIAQLVPPEQSAEERTPLNLKALVYLEKILGERVTGIHEDEASLIATVLSEMREEVVAHGGNYNPLPSKQLPEIIERHLKGEGNQEIAHELGISTDTVATRLSWNRRIIHERYDGEAAAEFRKRLLAHRTAALQPVSVPDNET